MSITDGEELKNRQVFSVAFSSVAVLLCAIKGKGINALSEPEVLMAGLFTSALNLRTDSGFATLYVHDGLLAKKD